jgi:natural product biosynthesis luciferase-like monooxygenase protein
MKFGLFYLPTYLPGERSLNTRMHNIVEQVEYADQIGFDYAWMVEHHFVRHGGFLSANYAFLSYLAARTKNIRLGTGATVLPLNDAVRVAEQAATLDQLSNGRLDFGVGRGFIRDEFDAFGVPMRESRERVEEGVDLILKAWGDAPLEYESQFRPKISGLNILPKPYQTPHPPIWNACLMSPESFEWTAQEGHNLLYVAYHVDHPVATERIGWYRDALPKHGREVEDHEVCCVYHAYFTEDEDDARLKSIVDGPMSEYAAAGIQAASKPPDPEAYKGYDRREAGQQQLNFERYFPGRVVMGGIDQVVDRIKELRRIGITQVSFLVDFGSLEQEEIMKSLKIFGEKILPRVRDI